MSDLGSFLSTWLGVIGGVYAVVQGGYLGFRFFRRPPRLEVTLPAYTFLVLDHPAATPRFQLDAQVTNREDEPALVYSASLSVTNAVGSIAKYRWSIFFKYEDTPGFVRYDSEAAPAAIGPQSTRSMNVEFAPETALPESFWSHGSEYELKWSFVHGHRMREISFKRRITIAEHDEITLLISGGSSHSNPVRMKKDMTEA